MLQLAFLLIGPQAFRARWWAVVIAGGSTVALALLVAALLALDAHGPVTTLAEALVGLIFIGHAAASALSLLDAPGTRRTMDLAKAAGFAVLGLLFLTSSLWDPLLLGLLFGSAFLFDGCARLTTTLLVRYRGWRWLAAVIALELTFALLILAGWPLPRSQTIALCVGLFIGTTGWLLIRLGLMLRDLETEAAILNLPIFAGRGWYEHAPVLVGDEPAPAADRPPLVIHVWTPVGSAVNAERRLLIDRYVGALDGNGEISTGHTSLEFAPDLYISHYPEIEMQPAPGEHARVLHSGGQNDVPGRFQPSYAAECAEWCPADAHVEIRRFSERRLRAFWIGYRQDATYNLTNRNCSIVVAAALDAALESALETRRPWLRLVLLLANPDLWAAALLRTRAEVASWTPGIVLDYARTLRRIVEPRPSSTWTGRLAGFIIRMRRRRPEALSS